MEAFSVIKEYRPARVYIAADGPRKHKKGEDTRCHETRQAIMNMIDWPCEIRTLFRDENLGCAQAVSQAITWFFNTETSGAIIEDDVIVGQDFFRFLEELLPHYETADNIMMITSQYFGSSDINNASRYGFSNSALIWGWGTWKRAWEKFDMNMATVPNISIWSLFKSYGLFEGLMLYRYWHSAYNTIRRGDYFNSWATRWWYSLFINNGLSITPFVNLSKNIGCSGVGGAHYQAIDKDPYAHLKIGRLNWPIIHPKNINYTKELLKEERSDFFRIRMIGAKKKIKNLFK